MICLSGVTTCLYNGIKDRIDYLNSQIKWNRKQNSANLKMSIDELKRIKQDIEEAIEFYLEHCVVSGKYLVDDFAEVDKEYKEYVGEVE